MRYPGAAESQVLAALAEGVDPDGDEAQGRRIIGHTEGSRDPAIGAGSANTTTEQDLAVGKTSGPAIDLYRVSFAQSDLWPEDLHPEQDQLVIEIYDHWLEPGRSGGKESL